MQLWSSTFGSSAAELKPEKLADLGWSSSAYRGITSVAAGFGHYALTEFDDKQEVHIRIWNLAAKTSRVVRPPTGHKIVSLKGITPNYLWVVIENFASPTPDYNYLARFPLSDK